LSDITFDDVCSVSALKSSALSHETVLFSDLWSTISILMFN